MKKHHAHVVTWRDSACHRGWRSVDEAYEASTITSIGWVVRSTPKSLTITTSISHSGNVTEPLTIPREAITKMRKLKNYVQNNS